MAAVVSGNGLGLFNSSLNQLGGGAGGSSRAGLGSQFVNVANGNLVLQSQDEQLLFRGLAIGQLRTYNSQGTVGQVGADGWLTGFERRVELLSGTFNAAGSVMRRHTGDGSYQDFTWVAADTYQSTSGDGAHDTLTWASGSRTWTYVEGSSRRDERYADHADATLLGRLTRIGDLKSDGTTPVGWQVIYDANQRIVEIRAEDGTAGGDALVFGYDGSGRLASVSTREGGVVRGQVEYGYDGQGRLTSVLVDLTPQDGAGDRDTWDGTTAANNDGYLFRTTYSYVDATSLRISQVRQSDGTLISYTYDGGGRVLTITRGDSNTNDADGLGETVTYAYAAGSTTVTDSLGRAWTYAYDAQGQLTSATSPAVSGQSDVTTYVYDAAGNLTQAKTVRGAQTLSQLDYQYDASGNATWQWDALGNAVQRSYSSSNRLLSEIRYVDVDPDRTGATVPANGLTTRYIYDGRDRLRFIVDATGAVVEYQYATAGNGIGQQSSTRSYFGAAYTGAYTDAALTAWATTTQKASSTLTEYGYDLWGRLAQTTAYATVDGNGAGVLDAAADLTRFSYDAQGLLRQQAILRGAARTAGGSVLAGSQVADYVYDGMGRLLGLHVHASEDALGNDATSVSTTYSYLDSGYQLAVTQDNGRVRTETRNAAGRTVSVAESGLVSGSTVTRTGLYYYDTAGQLRASQDANGGRSYFFYDAKGRLEATVDSTGAVVRNVYDGADRVVQSIQYANRVTTTTWLNAGAVTKATFADIGVVVDATNDRSQTSTYDSAGRLATQVDAAGTITTYGYDGAGRLVQVKITDAAQTAATARTTRYFHDAAGREVARLDAEGYLTETAYDPAGRPLSVTRYATVSPSAQWASGTVAQLRPTTAAGDQITRSYYDGRGNRVGELDAEGYLTEWIVDAAGNSRAERRYATATTWQSGDTLASLRSRAGGTYRESRMAYNGRGQLVTQTNAEGTVTRYSYDEAGRLVRTEAAQGTSEVREGYRRYNVFDELIGEIDGAGADKARTTLLGGKTLDDSTLTSTQLDQAYATYGVRHDYDALGRRIESIDAGGNKTWTFYDAAGRPTFVVRGMADGVGVANAQGEVTETRYNAFGQASDTFVYTGRITLATPGSRASAQTAIGALTYASATDTRRQYTYTTRGLLNSVTNAEGTQTRYTYSAFGDLTKEQLGYGSSAASTNDMVYDRRGLLTSRTEGSGSAVVRTLGRTYDAFGRVLTQTDARGSVTTFAYDRLGRQVTVSQTVQGRQELSSVVYDAFGRTVSSVDASGRSTAYAYDDVARSLTVTTPEGTQVVTVHNRHGQTVTVTERIAAGQTVTRSYAYDKSGRLTQSTDGLNHVETNEYDVRGLLSATVDASGRRVELRYDAAGRVLRRIEDPAGLNLATVYAYDAQGRQLSVTDASGRTTAYKYDREGRLLETAQDPAGLNLRTVYTYDALDRVLTVADAGGSVTQYAYDALGRRTSEIVDAGTGKLNLTTTYVYDKNDNLIRRIDASGATTRYYYDEADRLVFTVDALGAMTRQWYDLAGRVVATRQFAQQTAFATLTDTTTIASLDGRLVWNAFDQGEYRVYDQAGRLKYVLGIDGSVAETLYDQANRVVGTRRYSARFYPDTTVGAKLFAGTAVPADVVVTANNSADRQSFQVFDAAGRVRYTVDGLGNVRESLYDDADRLVGTRAYATSIALDATLRSQLVAGTATLATLASKVDAIDDDARDLRSYTVRDAAGRVRFTVDALGAVTEYLLDAGGRAVGTRGYAAAISIDATLLGKLKAGTAAVTDIVPRLSVDDSRDARNYAVHDAAGRVLLTVDAAGTVRSLSYDAAGRVVADTAYAQPANLSAALRTQLTAGTATASSVLATLTANNAADRSITYVRDSAGRVRYTLTRDSASTVTVSEARYDAMGRVVAEVAYATKLPAGTTPSVSAVAAAITAAGGDSASNQRTSQYLYDALGQVRYSLDALGNISERVYDGIGRLVEERAYDARVTTVPATESAVLAALDATLQTQWSTDFATLPVAGLSTSQVGAYGSALTHTNGQLVFQRTEGASNVYPSIYGAQYRSTADNVVFKGEVTTGASLTGTSFVFGVENNGSGANFRRGGAYISGGSLYRHAGVGTTNKDSLVGTLAVNTTYVVEAQVHEGGIEYYVYVKGGDKASGFRFSVDESEQWDSVRFRAWTWVGPGVTGAAVQLDNLSESIAPSRRTSYRYDSAGNVVAQTDALGKSETYTYDALGQQLARTDKLNNTWTYAYDAAGRRTSETSPAVSVATVDAAGNVTTTTRAIVTNFGYDALGNLTARTENAGQADARITQYVYDNRGNQIRTVFPDAWVINETTGELQASGATPTVDVSYDALGRAVVQKDVRGFYSYKVYDAAGRLAYEIDQEGYVTGYAYNAYGEQSGLTRYALALNAGALPGWSAGQALTLAQMETAGALARTDGNNRTLTSAYDQQGRKVTVTQSAVSYFKADGSADSSSPVTQYVYDSYGQLVKESVLLQGKVGQGDAVWADTWRFYDAMGRITMAVDAQGYVTASTYNSNGELIETVEYARAINTAGIVVGVRPGAPGSGDAVVGYDRITRWVYDVLGRKTSETTVRHYQRADGSSGVRDVTASFAYDANSRLTGVTNDAGTTTTAYDALGRTLSVAEPQRNVLATTAENSLLSSTGVDLTSAVYQLVSPYTEVSYDAYGNAVRTRRYANGLASGQSTPVADAGRDQIEVTRFDRQGRAVMSVSAEGARTYSAYDAADNITRRWYTLNGSDDARDAKITGLYTYDKTGRQLTSRQERKVGSDPVQVESAETVAYNAFGEITQKTQAGITGSLNYGYDVSGRLVTSNESGANRNFGYNLAGHQVREWHTAYLSSGQSVQAVTVSITDKLGRTIGTRLPSYKADTTAFSQTSQYLDRWGNVLQIIDGRGYQTNYRYNDFNQLIQDERPLVQVVAENGTSTWVRPINQWYYDANGRLLATRDANGNVRRNDYDAAGQLLRYTNALGQKTHYAYDAFGNQRLQQDALGYITFKEYDRQNRVVAIGDYLPGVSGTTRAKTALQQYLLNENGDRLRVRNALNHDALYDYDGSSHLIRSQTAAGVIQTYGYDVQGRKSRETYNTGSSTTITDYELETVRTDEQTWDYDIYGRLVDSNNLSGRDSDYAYDAASGQQTGETARGGYQITSGDASKTISYYANGLVREIVESSGTIYRYEYDAAGNRTLEQVITKDGGNQNVQTLTRTWYDSHNRIQRVTQDDQVSGKRVFDLTYEYDAVGNRRHVKAVSGYGPDVDPVPVTNTAPVVVKTVADRTVRKGKTAEFRVLFSDVFRDAEQDALSLTVTQNGGGALPSWLQATVDTSTGEIVFVGNPPAGMADQDLVVQLNAYETATPSNTRSTSFVVRVRANTAPVLTVAGTSELSKAKNGKTWGQSLSADAWFSDVDVGDKLTLSVVNAGAMPAWLQIDASNPGVVHLSGSSNTTGTYDLQIRATDESGASVVKTFRIVSGPNTAPTSPGNPAPREAILGRGFDWTQSLASLFSDPDGDLLSVTATGLPSWMSFQFQSDQAVPALKLAGQVPASVADGTVYTVTFTATDPDGATKQVTLTVTARANRAPVASNWTAPSLRVNDTYDVTIPISTLFNDLEGDQLLIQPVWPNGSYLPGWLNVSVDDAAGTIRFSGRPTSNAAAGNLSFQLRARDGDGLTSTANIAITVGADNAPTRDSNVPLYDQTASVGRTFSFTVPSNLYVDADNDAYSLVATQVTENTYEYFDDSQPPGQWVTVHEVFDNPLPSWIQFNAATRTFSGTVPANQPVGNLNIRVAAFDGRLQSLGWSPGLAITGDDIFTFAITPFNNLAPVYNGGLPNRTVVHGGAVDFVLPGGAFTEPNGDTLSYTAEVQINGVWKPLSDIGLTINGSTGRITGTAVNLIKPTLTARIIARDPQGLANGTAATFTFNVNNTAPVAGTIGAQSANRKQAFSLPTASYFSDVNQDTLTYSATGLPSGLTINTTTGVISGSSDAAPGSYSVTVTANDGRGGTATTAPFTVTIVNNPPSAPTINNVAAAAATSWSFTIPAFTDPNGDGLTYTVSGMPSWMAFDAGTRKLTGTPGPVGSWTITVTAKDPYNATATQAFVVSTPNEWPSVINAIPAQWAGRNIQWGYQLPGNIFADINGDSLTYSVSNLPSGLSFDPGTRTFSGKVLSQGAFAITVTASDGRGGTASTTLTLNVVNNPPQVQTPLPDRVRQQGQNATWTLPPGTFTDPNGDGLTYSLEIEWPGYWETYWEPSEAAYMSRWVPPRWAPGSDASLSIDGNGTITGNQWLMQVVGGGGAYEKYYRYKVVAHDGYGGTAESIFNVNVNMAPSAPYITNVGVLQGAATSWQLPAFGDETALTYSMSGLPAGLSFNPANRMVTGTASGSGAFTVYATANDGQGGVTTISFTMTVHANHAPTAPGIPNQNGMVGNGFAYQVTGFSDQDFGDTLTYTAGGLPPGLWISSTGVIQGTPSAAGGYGVTVYASDGRGGVASAYFVITIAAVPPPNTAPYVNPANPTPYGWFYGTNRHLVETQYMVLPTNTFLDANNDPLTYTILQKPDWLAYQWDPAQGHVFWGVPYLSGSFPITIRAQDPSGAIKDLTFSVDSTFDYYDPWNPTDPLRMPMDPMVAAFDMGAAQAPDMGIGEEQMVTGGGGMVQTMASIPVQTTEYWFAYDAENRIKVNNGKLQNGQIVANWTTVDSWELLYDAVGHEVGRVQSNGLATYVYRTAYDLRGNKVLEFHAEAIGGLSQGVDKEHRYDATGQLLATRSYYGANAQMQGNWNGDFGRYEIIDVSGFIYASEDYSYDSDGRLVTQVSFERPSTEWWLQLSEWDTGGGQDQRSPAVLQWNTTIDYTGGYDQAGRAWRYKYTSADIGGATHTYTTTFQGWSSYQEKLVSGHSSNQNYRPTTNTLTYDGFGRLLSQREHTEYGNLDDRMRYYAYSGDGKIQSRRAGTVNGSGVFSQTPDAFGRRDNVLFVHAGGQQQAELAEGGKIRAYSVPQLQGLSGAGRYQAGGGKVVVLAGETLKAVAQRVYGNASLWYVLADANGLSGPDVTPGEGTSLNAPSVNVSSNDANTFKPYNPNEAIGSTSPGLPYITPPPKNKCTALVNVLSTVVGYVVGAIVGIASGNYYLAAAAQGAVQEHSRQVFQAMANGQYDWGQLRRNMLLPGGGFKGDKHDIFDPLGGPVEGGIDHRAVAVSAATSVATYAVGNWAGQYGQYAKVAAEAATSYAANYQFSKWAGYDVHWNNRQLGTNVAAAMANEYLLGNSRANSRAGAPSSTVSQPSNQPFSWTQLVNVTGQNVVRSGVQYVVGRAFEAPNTHWNTLDVLADAFGNALGSAFAGGIQTISTLRSLTPEQRADYDGMVKNGIPKADALKYAQQTATALPAYLMRQGSEALLDEQSNYDPKPADTLAQAIAAYQQSDLSIEFQNEQPDLAAGIAAYRQFLASSGLNADQLTAVDEMYKLRGGLRANGRGISANVDLIGEQEVGGLRLPGINLDGSEELARSYQDALTFFEELYDTSGGVGRAVMDVLSMDGASRPEAVLVAYDDTTKVWMAEAYDSAFMKQSVFPYLAANNVLLDQVSKHLTSVTDIVNNGIAQREALLEGASASDMNKLNQQIAELRSHQAALSTLSVEIGDAYKTLRTSHLVVSRDSNFAGDTDGTTLAAQGGTAGGTRGQRPILYIYQPFFNDASAAFQHYSDTMRANANQFSTLFSKADVQGGLSVRNKAMALFGVRTGLLTHELFHGTRWNDQFAALENPKSNYTRYYGMRWAESVPNAYADLVMRELVMTRNDRPTGFFQSLFNSARSSGP